MLFNRVRPRRGESAAERLRAFTLIEAGALPDEVPFERVARLEDAIRWAIADNEELTKLLARLELHDPTTHAHLYRVGRLAGHMALVIGIGRIELRNIVSAAIFHDIGKLAIPAAILQAPRSLTSDEWTVMRSHTLAGQQILNRLGQHNTALIAATHHERIDGSGYPYGLRGSAISLQTQIVTIADVYDTMTSGRPYARAVSTKKALDEIERYAGRHYAVDLVDALFAALENADHDSAQA
jgi:putative two-component system response regulator